MCFSFVVCLVFVLFFCLFCFNIIAVNIIRFNIIVINFIIFVEDQNSTAFNTPRFDEFSGTLVTVIMALFLLVANILLLNLLIAIFK